MAFDLVSASNASIILTVVFLAISGFVLRRSIVSLVPKAGTGHTLVETGGSIDPSIQELSKTLASALPDNTIFPSNTLEFRQSMGSYWAQQECEVVPACVIRPRDVRQLCIAIKILKSAYDGGKSYSIDESTRNLFAIRSGGHSPVSNAATIQGGVLIDLGLFNEVTSSEDGSSVVIGAGAKWMDVSKVLDEKGLAVVGGRNSAVGVGGLTLGGGLSFFSPRCGLVCSNIISYEVVLADGSVTTASASTRPELWRALKGSANNFGIVTRFTARSFAAGRIWSGFLYMPAFQATKVLQSFHESVKQTDLDDHAAGPLACFSYVQQLGIQIISVNLVYTKTPENENKWPDYWQKSPFRSLWRLWSTCKVRTLTSATEELNSLNPPGRRQLFATTTIRNDFPILTAAHAAFRNAIAACQLKEIKGLVWTLVLQPLITKWVRKGDPNPLGLHDGTDEPLIIVSFTVNWDLRRDDDSVKSTTRRVIEQIEAIASANQTGHRWRYLNYCAEWQKPFQGYGEENWRFLKDVSRKYDPDGLFQRGCIGGFKLDIDKED